MKLKEMIKFNKLLFTLFVVWMIAMMVFMFWSCSKQEMYVTPTDQNVVFDKSITASSQEL